jgi:hypothetical protein
VTYLVRIVGPAAAISWLEKGVEVELQANAEHFRDEESAEYACTKFNAAARKRWPQPPIAHVYIPEEE